MKSLLFSFVLFISISVYSQNLPSFNVIRYDTSYVLNGYYFMTSKDNMIILDKDVNVVYYKPVKEVLDFTLEKNGKMFFSNKEGLYEMDSTFHIIDSFACKNGVRYDAHDRLISSDGHLLLLGEEDVVVSCAQYPELKKRNCIDTVTARFAVIQEQDKQGNVTFEWHSKDHFSLVDADSFYVKYTGIFDLTHSNSLEIDNDENILLSSKNLNEITKINKKNGSIIWRLGGKNNEFEFINSPQPFYGQHNIRRLSNGHYTLFDNGDNVKKHGARALEFEIDEKNKRATLVWSYTYKNDKISLARGNVQRLNEEYTLVSFGKFVGEDVCFVIINRSGEKTLQINGVNPYRVMNYSSLPFELHRPEISCFDSAGGKYLDAGYGYISYKWSTGDSTRVIKLSKADSYSVFVNYGDGGFISSEKCNITDVSIPDRKRRKK